METKGDKVPRDHLDLGAQWDPREFRDSLDHLECLEDQEVLASQVLLARLEYPVDTLASTSPSNLSAYLFIYLSIICTHFLLLIRLSVILLSLYCFVVSTDINVTFSPNVVTTITIVLIKYNLHRYLAPLALCERLQCPLCLSGYWHELGLKYN